MSYYTRVFLHIVALAFASLFMGALSCVVVGPSLLVGGLAGTIGGIIVTGWDPFNVKG